MGDFQQWTPGVAALRAVRRDLAARAEESMAREKEFVIARGYRAPELVAGYQGVGDRGAARANQVLTWATVPGLTAT